jgi:hypothetical protein
VTSERRRTTIMSASGQNQSCLINKQHLDTAEREVVGPVANVSSHFVVKNARLSSSPNPTQPSFWRPLSALKVGSQSRLSKYARAALPSTPNATQLVLPSLPAEKWSLSAASKIWKSRR